MGLLIKESFPIVCYKVYYGKQYEKKYPGGKLFFPGSSSGFYAFSRQSRLAFQNPTSDEKLFGFNAGVKISFESLAVMIHRSL